MNPTVYGVMNIDQPKIKIKKTFGFSIFFLNILIRNYIIFMHEINSSFWCFLHRDIWYNVVTVVYGLLNHDYDFHEQI